MIYTWGYILLTAFSAVLRHTVGNEIPGMLIIFLSTFYAIVFFHALNYGQIKQLYKKTFEIKKLYILMTFLVLVMWVGAFLIPAYFTPTVQVFSALAVASFYGAFFTAKKTRQGIHVMQFIMIALILVTFYSVYYQQYPFQKFLILLGWTFLTGTAGYLYFVKSYELNQSGFSAKEILAVRFWLLLLFPLFFVIKDHLYLLINFKVLYLTFAVGVITLIIPIYCSQKSIEKIGANLHSILIGLSPITTFLLERLFIQESRGIVGYLAVILALVIAAPYFIRYLITMYRNEQCV